jgi:hypothetical protein
MAHSAYTVKYENKARQWWARIRRMHVPLQTSSSCILLTGVDAENVPYLYLSWSDGGEKRQQSPPRSSITYSSTFQQLSEIISNPKLVSCMTRSLTFYHAQVFRRCQSTLHFIRPRVKTLSEVPGLKYANLLTSEEGDKRVDGKLNL